ncbi:MAG: hypothetical protein MRZ79_13265 [Bacteroidia bacterium]|nr:hypothetical protein [Bacteroidia bacterium]
MNPLQLLLSFSLVFAMLIAPCFVLMAYWYRRQLSNTLMIWKNPEMVIVTITFSVLSLILFIVGTSCFFTYFDVLDSSHLRIFNEEKFLRIGMICSFLLVGLILSYVAIRMLLVRVITDKGIVVNDKILRLPDFRNIIQWHEVSDYYLVSDYPNVIFTLIVQKGPMKYERMSIRVPIYIRDDFEDMLETKMYSASAIQARTDISSHKFSEN